MKKFTLGLLSLSIMASGACLTGCKCNPNDPADPQDPSVATAYVNIDINPSIDLVIDQYGKVMSVNANNDDARVLLYNETGIVGKTIEEAVKKITTLAKNLGYLTDEDIIEIVTQGISQDKVNQIKSSINSVNPRRCGICYPVLHSGRSHDLLRLLRVHLRYRGCFQWRDRCQPGIQGYDSCRYDLRRAGFLHRRRCTDSRLYGSRPSLHRFQEVYGCGRRYRAYRLDAQGAEGRCG